MLKNEKKIFSITTDAQFNSYALEVFAHQYEGNAVYRKWCDLLRVDPSTVNRAEQLPFLPVEFFKSHNVVTGTAESDTLVFTSSGTTSRVRARHFVKDPDLYEASFTESFRRFYGEPADYCILALLPSYLEREGSSLVYMCRRLIARSAHPLSGFYLKNLPALVTTIETLKARQQKVLLIGVSYALMDLAETGVKLDGNFIVMETGGMKGTRQEMLKPELHEFLKKGLGVEGIHSEYGMTELLSQAYSLQDGIFTAPPWMRFYVREVDDPLALRKDGKTGGINVIDLANLHSCAFIATKDLGRLNTNNGLELMGRYDHSDVRGCNLMLEKY